MEDGYVFLLRFSTLMHHLNVYVYFASGPFPMCVLALPDIQMVWENGCTVIVMMTALVEDGEKQCERYWPDEGSSLYHIYEVHFLL